MKSSKKLESVKTEMFAVKTPKTVIGGMQMNATIEWVNGKKKVLADKD